MARRVRHSNFHDENKILKLRIDKRMARKTHRRPTRFASPGQRSVKPHVTIGGMMDCRRWEWRRSEDVTRALQMRYGAYSRGRTLLEIQKLVNWKPISESDAFIRGAKSRQGPPKPLHG
jgi:hypothetical protein